MNSNKLEELHECEFRILKTVTHLCDENDISYFLDSGTLLGAVRHSGFIPWDDDIDICMPYPDYMKFLSIAQEKLGSNYFVQTFETEENFYRSYAKVRYNSSTVIPMEWKSWNVNQGAWIDIFPAFYANNMKEVEKFRKIYKRCAWIQQQDFQRCLIRGGIAPKSFNGRFFRLVIWLYGILPMRYRQLLHKRLLNQIFLAHENGDYFCRCGHKITPFKSEWYNGQKVYLTFEDEKMRVPSDYDAVLRFEYNDYMEIPPKEKQGSHGEVFVDTNTPYSFYLSNPRKIVL